MNKSEKTLVRTVSVIFPLIFIFIGIVFLALGIVFRYADNARKSGCTEITEAEVVKLVSSSDDSGGYAPVFSYTVGGKNYTVQENFYSSPPEYSVGETVDIHYNPDNPNKVYSDQGNIFKILYTIFISIGAAMIVIPLIIVVVVFVITRNKESDDEISQYNSL
jgi:uncharacterized membrane protein